MKILAVIPSRYASTRLPGKPLLDIDGKTMIQRVYEQVARCTLLDGIVVATDDHRIESICNTFHIPVVMTSPVHENGTARCKEAMSLQPEIYDLVINIQGDEPFIHPESIVEIISIFEKNPNADIGTLYQKSHDLAQYNNPSIIKVVKSIEDKALYFSRSPIPFLRDAQADTEREFNKHVGIYAYKASVLEKIAYLKESPLEQSEKLEQLRWLEHGYSIYLAETQHPTISIDTPEDYENVLKNLKKYQHES